jgi:hypothetical protein
MLIGIRKGEKKKKKKKKKKKNVNSKEHYCVLLCSLTNKALDSELRGRPAPPLKEIY